MADTSYGNYQTPSSRPPEPPYRTGTLQEQSYNEPAYAELQESARESEAPRGNVGGIDVPSYETTVAMTGEAGGAYAAPSQAERQAPTGKMPPQQAPTGKMPPQAGGYGEAQKAYSTPVPAQKPPKQPKSGGGAGKTFLFGFLGALVACVLCIGGFMLFNGQNAKSPNTASVTTETGSKDTSVIDAVEEGESLAEAVAAKALPSVVAVYNYTNQSGTYGFGYGMGQSDSSEPSKSGMGSGVIISDDGYIITNYHVVDGAEKITVTVDGEERDAEFVGGDSSSDVAVLKVENTEGLVAADIGNSDDLKIGEWVMTIGAPLGLEQSVATGVVSATNRSTVMSDSAGDGYSMYSGSANSYKYYPNMIQTDAVINPGNSGGALVDADGKLIGINTMISSYSGDYAGVGFAIPINYAKGIAEQVIEGKTPTHAALGVSISSVNSQIAKRYNLSTDKGAYIAAVSPNSGAAEAGLEVGDIITAIDGKAIESTTDVTLDVREHNVGDTVKVTVNRGGETRDIDVILSSDESVNASGENSGGQEQQGQGNGYGQGQGQGNGYGQGQGNSIEDLLRMFGF